MKKRYQIEQQWAVQQFRRLATEQNPNIQMILPMADIVGLLQEGVGNLLRHAGLELMHLVMDEEVKALAGERHQQHEQRRAHRWGKENGYCVVDSQKVPIKRTRLRSGDTARSLEEGLEETLTVHKLRVPDKLRRTLCCTNMIESAFSIVETVCRNVKRWRTGDQIERWVELTNRIPRLMSAIIGRHCWRYRPNGNAALLRTDNASRFPHPKHQPVIVCTAVMTIDKTFKIGNELEVNRLGFGAMRLTGKGIWGETEDLEESQRVLQRAVKLGANFIDTADSYGPEVSERLIGEALSPLPKGLVVATKAD